MCKNLNILWNIALYIQNESIIEHEYEKHEWKIIIMRKGNLRDWQKGKERYNYLYYNFALKRKSKFHENYSNKSCSIYDNNVTHSVYICIYIYIEYHIYMNFVITYRFKSLSFIRLFIKFS